MRSRAFCTLCLWMSSTSSAGIARSGAKVIFRAWRCGSQSSAPPTGICSAPGSALTSHECRRSGSSPARVSFSRPLLSPLMISVESRRLKAISGTITRSDSPCTVALPWQSPRRVSPNRDSATAKRRMIGFAAVSPRMVIRRFEDPSPQSNASTIVTSNCASPACQRTSIGSQRSLQ